MFFGCMLGSKLAVEPDGQESHCLSAWLKRQSLDGRPLICEVRSISAKGTAMC